MMERMRNLFRILTLFAGFALMTPSLVAAQVSEDCGWLWLCEEQGYHEVNSPSDLLENPHSVCKLCIYGECHPPCEMHEEDEDVQAAYRSLIEAAADRNVPGVFAASLAGAHRFAEVNILRGSIQVWSCDGKELAANIPLEASMMALAITTVGTTAQGASRIRSAILEESTRD